jgi:universal stress protein E
MSDRRVLFAIRDPGAPRQPGLAKAIQVAKAQGAALELFHALTETLYVDFGRYEAGAVDKLRERIEGAARVHLVRLCEHARKHGVEADYSVEWDYPPHEAVVSRAVSVGASLIVAECHKGIRTRPWLVPLTDWELLRTSPVPVLLLKNARPYHRPVILAAVDPAHAHAKPHALDERIVAAGAELGKGLRGTLHMLHANYPSIVGADPSIGARRAATSWSTLTFEELQEQERAIFEEFRARTGIPRTRAHVVDGNPVTIIPRVAGKLKAGIVVMGAISRSGLERVFIGNTAERILGALPCDVLVIKPKPFTRQALRPARGMRVKMPATPLVA